LVVAAVAVQTVIHNMVVLVVLVHTETIQLVLVKAIQ
jgi:hypothetical protein